MIRLKTKRQVNIDDMTQYDTTTKIFVNKIKQIEQ